VATKSKKRRTQYSNGNCFPGAAFPASDAIVPPGSIVANRV
jgi:hypothetical protein